MSTIQHPGRTLTADEAKILQALPLFNPVMKKLIADYADAAIEAAAESAAPVCRVISIATRKGCAA